ncbi:winged helix-turn-helix domain-containing protein [Streptococcus rupicaprae]|uniref:winged helix-turn-helix domain-containing protein n=1 Tax=Streptococcus rupicaprae TaxID=759619 RepID=UPI00339B1E0E
MIILHDKHKVSSYETIAVSIARLIHRQEINVGAKLDSMVKLGRRYGVSRETVRNGLKLLADGGVVSLHHGKGAVVISRECAIAFLDDFRQQTEIRAIYSEISEMIHQQESDLDKLKHLVGQLTQKLSPSLKET